MSLLLALLDGGPPAITGTCASEAIASTTATGLEIFTGSSGSVAVASSAATAQEIFTGAASSVAVASSAATAQEIFTGTASDVAIASTAATAQEIFTGAAANTSVASTAATAQEIFTGTASDVAVASSAAAAQEIFTGAATNEAVTAVDATGNTPLSFIGTASSEAVASVDATGSVPVTGIATSEAVASTAADGDVPISDQHSVGGGGSMSIGGENNPLLIAMRKRLEKDAPPIVEVVPAPTESEPTQQTVVTTLVIRGEPDEPLAQALTDAPGHTDLMVSPEAIDAYEFPDTSRPVILTTLIPATSDLVIYDIPDTEPTITTELVIKQVFTLPPISTTPAPTAPAAVSLEAEPNVQPPAGPPAIEGRAVSGLLSSTSGLGFVLNGEDDDDEVLLAFVRMMHG